MPQQLDVLTEDGWRLALHHYRPTEERRQHAVICCHGLGANRIAFDVAEEVSLARHLAGCGYHVLLLELRGHGASERPARGGKEYGWCFDDYLARDLPCAVEHGLRLTGAPAVHWIGHSMGGVLLYAHLATVAEPKIRSAVTVGSSLDYSASASGYHRLIGLKGALGWLQAVPVDAVARSAALLVGRARSPFERFSVWSSNVDAQLFRRICQEGFHPVSPPVMQQLASALEDGGLRSRDGLRCYAELLACAKTPVLALGGSRDPQCPPAAVKATADALGAAPRELKICGREHGEADDYGHFDLLMGRRAAREVFPHIVRWLDAHDGDTAVS